MKIEFIGATREVTGSKFLITTDEGKKILLDCGMFQGKGLETDAMNRDLGFNPEEIDHVILTHAHIDHSGLIPYLYKLGFRGSVVCTPATRDLCSIMLVDSAHIQELDAKWFNKKQARKHLPLISPIYNVVHAERCMELFVTTAYGRRLYIDEHISVKFTNTAHMLGSGAANIRIKEGGEVKNICYTGDIGRKSNYLLSGWSPFPQCDYLITESTYGNRLHKPLGETGEEEAFERNLPHLLAKRFGVVALALRLDGVGDKHDHIERAHIDSGRRVPCDGLENAGGKLFEQIGELDRGDRTVQHGNRVGSRADNGKVVLDRTG